MDIKKHNLLVILTVTIAISLGAVVYLGLSLWQIGGPYNVDSDGCGYKYVNYPGHGKRQVRTCMNDNVFVLLAKFLALAGPVTSTVILVLLLQPASPSKENQ
jgi:hypothetical protein